MYYVIKSQLNGLCWRTPWGELQWFPCRELAQAMLDIINIEQGDGWIIEAIAKEGE